VKVVCTTCCYRGLEQDELTGTLEGAPKAGHRYIDVHRVTIPEEPEAARAYGAEVRTQCVASGLEPVGIHCVGFGGRDEEHLAAQVKRITTQIAFCQGLGGETVVSTGAHKRGEGPIANVVECLRRLEPVLAGTPIKIGLEPHHRNVIEQIEDYDAIFAEIDNPQIGLCPDIGHFHASGVDVYRLLDKYAGRIFQTHIKDHVGTQSVGIGHGEIDIARFVRALHEIGYDGCLSVELEHKDKENTQRYVEEARVLLDGILAKL
jgi:sugar phosphate isomerase/epimerase